MWFLHWLNRRKLLYVLHDLISNNFVILSFKINLQKMLSINRFYKLSCFPSLSQFENFKRPPLWELLLEKCMISLKMPLFIILLSKILMLLIKLFLRFFIFLKRGKPHPHTYSVCLHGPRAWGKSYTSGTLDIAT